MAHNLRQCQTLVRKAVASKASALFLPEASDWISSGPEESLSLVKSVKDSEFVRGIQAEAKASRLPIYVGVHEPTESGEKVKNTLLWVDERGEITQRYQKLHMFDMDVTEGPKMSESKCVTSLEGAHFRSDRHTGRLKKVRVYCPRFRQALARWDQ